MTLPSSGRITLQQINAEFGRPLTGTLKSLYGAASGIPTSGPIMLSHFYGKSAIRTFKFIRIEFTDVGPSGYANAAEIRLTLNGVVLATPGSINASSAWAGQFPVYTIDNNKDTYWVAGASGNGHWVGLLYAGQVNFNGINIMPGITYNNVNTIRIYGSNGSNSGPYELLREFTGLAGTWVVGQYKALGSI